MVRAVTRFIPLEHTHLPDEFFPAHLTIALIDAVFRSRPEARSRAMPCADRYCRRFGLEAVRTDRWEHPPAEVQDALRDLVGRYHAIGTERMADEVFRSRQGFPGTKISRAECVLAAAKALRGAGVEVLQDLSIGSQEEIANLLLHTAGLGPSTSRLLLMYSGEDGFVCGDAHVRTFVGNALGRGHVPAADAVELVRQTAHELIVAPRFLDHAIWRFGSSFSAGK